MEILATWELRIEYVIEPSALVMVPSLDAEIGAADLLVLPTRMAELSTERKSLETVRPNGEVDEISIEGSEPPWP